MARLKNSHPPDVKAAFLLHYEETGRIDLACKHVGVGRRTHYNWLERDEEYRKHFETSKRCVVALLEDEALRRAVEGIEKVITVAGERETVREYSDVLLIFLLKGAMPEKYREQYQISGTLKHGLEEGLAAQILARRQKRLEQKPLELPPTKNGEGE